IENAHVVDYHRDCVTGAQAEMNTVQSQIQTLEAELDENARDGN
ncbi:unnamed protein product, partial [Rotaria magnacalcarata]